jgi:hypothetical protein
MNNNHTAAQEGPVVMVRHKPFERWNRFFQGTWLGSKYYTWKVMAVQHLERWDQSTSRKKKLFLFWCFMFLSIGFFVLVTVRELNRKIEPIPVKREFAPGAKKSSPAIILDESDLKNIDKLTEGAIGDSL